MMNVLEEYVHSAYTAVCEWEYAHACLDTVQDVTKDVPSWVWVALAAFGCTVYLKVRHDRTYGTWKRQKIPGPKPLPFLGNSNLLISCKNLHQLNIDLNEKYGHKGFFGCYQGSTPVLVVSNPELIREVMIKQFDSFSERSTGYMMDVKYMRKILSVLPYAEWKRTRNAMTPAFTGAKMKKMVVVINQVVGNLSRKLDTLAEGGNRTAEVELKPLFQAYTLDVICNVVFSLQVDIQLNPDNEIAKMMRKMMAINARASFNPAVLVVFLAPFLSKIVKIFSPNLGLNVDAGIQAANEMKIILEKRKRGDDSDETSFFLTTLVEMVEQHERTNGSEGIDFETAAAQSMLMLLAGYEGTSNLLTWASYYLAMHPHIQQQVKEEMETVLGPGNKEASYENLSKLKLLENVLMETLRLHPIFRNQREARFDTTLGPGIQIKKGYIIEVHPNVVHMDPSIWDKPDEFRPSRFDPEEASKRSPYAFNSFGIGPRNCIGNRMALVKAKMAMIGLLTDYKLEMGEFTLNKMTEFAKNQFMDPLEPIRLNISRR